MAQAVSRWPLTAEFRVYFHVSPCEIVVGKVTLYVSIIPPVLHTHSFIYRRCYTESSKKMDGIWNRYTLKSTRRIYTFGILKCSEKFEVLDLP